MARKRRGKTKRASPKRGRRFVRQRSRFYPIAIVLGIVAVGIVATLVLRPRSDTTSRFADPDNTEQVAMGQTIYGRSCASCHGANLEGQPNWKKPLPTGGLPAPPHDETGHTWHHDDALLFQITKHGGQNDAARGFRSNMPAFKDLLTDEEIWAVLAYIKSRWPAAIRARQEHITRKSR